MRKEKRNLWAIAPRFDSVYGLCIPWTCAYTRRQAWELFVRDHGYKDCKRFTAIRVHIVLRAPDGGGK